MIIIQDVIVSEDVTEKHFVCNLQACKGACCWEGDWGAPLEKAELQTLEHIYEDIKPFLSQAGIDVIEKEGFFLYYDEPKEYGTPLLDNGACAYMTYNETGIAQCGIEQAHKAGKTDFKKPISCHLYPIRVKENPQQGFESLQYDDWEICSAACSLGKKEQVPVYEFVKEAIIRKYGNEFYEALDAAVKRGKS